MIRPLLLTAGLCVLGAGPASAQVLVRKPPSDAFCLDRIRLGVRYEPATGGSRAYRLRVRTPNGRIVFSRSGLAPNRWRIFRFRAIDSPGVRFGFTTYRVAYRANGRLIVYKLRILCGE